MSYIDDLTRALAAARENLEKSIFPKLHDACSLQSTAMNGLLDVLINKRLIHYAPYDYDSKMTDIELPEVSPFPDTEKASVIGTRIAHYARMLEFVINYYQFTCDYLTPKRLSSLEKLSQVFLWDDFQQNSRSPNTAALASIIEVATPSLENITAGIVRNAIEQLGSSTVSIRSFLSKGSLYHRETYKLFVRTKVLPEVPQNKLAYGADIGTMFAEVKKTFAAKLKKNPFFQDLINEVLWEDYSDAADAKKADILKNLSQMEVAQKKKEAPKADYQQVLISGLRALSNSASHFELALEKIISNEELITKSNQTLFSKLAAAIRKAFNVKEPEKEIVIAIQDPATQTTKKTVINLPSFKAALEQKIRVFQNINSNSPQMNAKLRQIPEKSLYDNFVKYLSECNSLVNEMSGLDQYYKTVKPNIRKKIKGIRIEITTITNSIINANQYKAEYAEHIDYEQQKKILGL